MQRFLLRTTALAAIALAAGSCYRVRNQLVPTAASPQDVYRCVQLELGRAGYAIVGADRASGWLHAQKRINDLIEPKDAEIYVTVIPDEEGSGSHVQLSDNSHAADDADLLREVCAM